MVELAILHLNACSAGHDKLPKPLMTQLRAIILERVSDKDVKLIVV